MDESLKSNVRQQVNDADNNDDDVLMVDPIIPQRVK